MQQIRSRRIIHKLRRYTLLDKMYQVIFDNPNDDPTTNEALEDVDVQEWKSTMDREMESKGSDSIWSLVEAPRGVKAIRSKLIYKKNSLGKPCVYRKIQGIVVVFPILYVDKHHVN